VQRKVLSLRVPRRYSLRCNFQGFFKEPLFTSFWCDYLGDIRIDYLVVFFAIVYYMFLCVVYILRAYNCEKQELKLAPVFSLLLIPFTILWVSNIYIGSDVGRLICGSLIIVYLLYDLWYRMLTKKKPVHHPDRWPPGLIIYLILLQIGSVSLNWYGFLVSKALGFTLIVCYFVMLGCYGFYQAKYNKRKNPKTKLNKNNAGEGI
jgi:hypothetical protein